MPNHSYAEDQLEISLLTCSSGSPVYATFGHSAIRVKDVSNNRDIVFDFGVFNFNDPLFLPKFLKGELLYSLETQPFRGLLHSYKQDNRSVIEERLNLTLPQKKKIYLQLLQNLRPENKNYRYDFLYDNCATRIRDLFFTLPVIFPTKDQPTTLTFRNHLHSYLPNKSWIKFGIDALLGSSVDQQMTHYEQLFLPDPLSKQLKKVRIQKNGKEEALLLASSVLVEKEMDTKTALQYLTPTLIFSLLMLCLGGWSWKKKNPDTILWYLFLLLGVIGVFLLGMWLLTNHPTSANNWNLWWANPLYLLVVLIGVKRVSNSVLWGIVILNIILLLSWYFLPQQLNIATIPIVLGVLFLLVLKINYSKETV